MNQLAEQTEFQDETVAEALANSQPEESDSDDGFEIEVVDDTPEEDKGKASSRRKTLNLMSQMTMRLRSTVKASRSVSSN